MIILTRILYKMMQDQSDREKNKVKFSFENKKKENANRCLKNAPLISD